MKNLIYIGCLVLLMTSSCKKDEFVGPELQTVSVTALSPSKLIFNGKIVKTGNSRILDYGFVYGAQPNVDEKTGTKVSLGNSASEGEFSKEVDNIQLSSTYYNTTIYSRAYLTDERGTAYGQLITTALPIPSAGAISPAQGKSGDIVKITGKFYSPSLNTVKVTFQGVAAKVISATDTEISAEIPVGMSARHGNTVSVVVTLGSVPVTVSNGFMVMANVKDFSPKSGPIGTSVTFSGDNMPTDYYYGNNFVITFGSVNVNSYSYVLQANVPYTVRDKVQISVTANGQKTVLPGEFTVLSPEISSVTPESVMPGMTVNIQGSNFPINIDGNLGYPAAKLGNGSYQNLSNYYQNQYSYVIPQNTEEGEYTLSLKLGSYEITAPGKIKVKGFSARSFTPETGGPGREVNITGNFIKDQGYNVYFGTQTSWAVATSSTNLRTNVPSGLNAGEVRIGVDLADKRVLIPGNFTIIGPSISSFSPSSGVAGTIITIRGAGLAPNEYNTIVKFGTIQAPLLSVNEGTITVAVPSNLNIGNMKISVTTNGQTVVSDHNFTATN